jgi:predicted DNA-binding transcriptional regulator AlpA
MSPIENTEIKIPVRQPASALPSTLRCKEAAKLIGVSEKTFANWRWRGIGPDYIKLPGEGGKGAVRYDRDTVLQWVNSHVHRSTSEKSNGGGRK